MHKVRRWTKLAKECYVRGCNCVGCYYYEQFFNKERKCQVKKEVIELVKTIGLPDDLRGIYNGSIRKRI